MKQTVIVVGIGEIGGPLLELASEHCDAVGVDLQPSSYQGPCDVMHICYPGGITDFIERTVEYINRFRPGLTVINSTVPIGTTRQVTELAAAAVVFSPMRGKHRHMRQDLLRYTKYVGGMDPEWSARAADHFSSLGMTTKIVSSPEAAELAKLTETTYFGLLIAWAQEVERYCDALHLSYDEVSSFYDEVDFFPPVRYFPGVIGGHCVMPNIELLKETFQSQLLAAIEHSNQMKVAMVATP